MPVPDVGDLDCHDGHPGHPLALNHDVVDHLLRHKGPRLGLEWQHGKCARLHGQLVWINVQFRELLELKALFHLGPRLEELVDFVDLALEIVQA